MRSFVAWSIAVAAVLSATSVSAEANGTTDRAGLCASEASAAADAMLERFSEAIATRHPDKVTRLFAPDATFSAHHAAGVRASYDQIRDAFVYFLVTEPAVTFATMTPSSGCGIIALEGEATWRRTAVKPAAAVETPVSITLILVETPDGWLIQHYAEERIEGRPAASKETAASTRARSPAVAGFVARARAATSPQKPEPSPAGTDGYRAGRWVADVLTFD